EFAYVQVAVLFTSCGGQRRLRIHNLCLPVSADYGHLFRVTDQDALVTYLLKTAVTSLRGKTPKEVRRELSQRCARILVTYREKTGDTANLGQLLLPECLKLLPLYVNCILRHEALSGGPELTVDDRAWQMQLVESCRVDAALELLYPRIFEMSSMSSAGTNADEFTVPTCVRASYENLQSDKAYLIENGLFIFLWVGSTVVQEWITDVFNAPSFTALDSESVRT
uniref:Gelsolin-like domain-containing protein n=1 Tax=Steinernema glaseri TaxID=37863 RepID=A0A1I8ADC1_9BILA